MKKFRCYPSRVLKTIAGMRPGKSTVYLILILRIYESGGVCNDTASTIAVRCDLQIGVVKRALSDLIEERKIANHGDGFSLPAARNPLNSTLRAAVLERDNWICVYCADPANEADHVIPVCQGGADEIENLVASCKRCNCSKGGLTPEQWANRDDITFAFFGRP